MTTAGGRPWLQRTVIHGLLLVTLVCLVDGFCLEPFALVVTHHDVFPASGFHGARLKIAHLSDMHTSGEGRLERALFEALEREKPDLIVISGDTVDAAEEYEPAAKVLAKIHAPLGVFMVQGNWENWRPAKDPRGFVAASKAHLLMNESAKVRDGVYLAGFDDISGAPNIRAALSDIPASAYVIGLFHSPAFFGQLPSRVSLAFAGHTHGGQVRLPLLGAMWFPAGSGHYDSGWYTEKQSRMYVSRGLGTSRLPVRFRCSPELAIITLHDGGER